MKRFIQVLAVSAAGLVSIGAVMAGPTRDHQAKAEKLPTLTLSAQTNRRITAEDDKRAEAARKAQEAAKAKAAQEAARKKAADDAQRARAAQEAAKAKAAQEAARTKAAQDAARRKAAEDAARKANAQSSKPGSVTDPFRQYQGVKPKAR